VTVNTLLGKDAIEPLFTAARERERGAGAGADVQPGCRDVEDLRLEDAECVWERSRCDRGRAGGAGVGETGISDVGAVMGATVPAHLERARELMGRATFLLPGVGAQGGQVEDLAPAFAPDGPAAWWSASRQHRRRPHTQRHPARGSGSRGGRAPARARVAQADRVWAVG